MRWRINIDHLTKREITKFAWLPIIVKRWDKREIVWLENVILRQTWYSFGEDIRIYLFGGYWKNDWIKQ